MIDLPSYGRRQLLQTTNGEALTRDLMFQWTRILGMIGSNGRYRPSSTSSESSKLDTMGIIQYGEGS